MLLISNCGEANILVVFPNISNNLIADLMVLNFHKR